MIIRLFLKLFAAALVILIIADVFYELHLGWISNLILRLGDDILLLSFALLLISGMIFFGKQIIASIKNYFSQQQRARRQLFFSISRNQYLQRLFNQKKQQMRYFADLKKARLLTQNDKKQARLLAKTMLRELKLVKSKLSESEYKQYQQAIKQAAAQAEMQRLLELQQEISKL